MVLCDKTFVEVISRRHFLMNTGAFAGLCIAGLSSCGSKSGSDSNENKN